MRESRKNGIQIGLSKATTLVTEKSVKCKEIIKKHATDFGGTLNDQEVMVLCKISRNTYYKYKRAVKALEGCCDYSADQSSAAVW